MTKNGESAVTVFNHPDVVDLTGAAELHESARRDPDGAIETSPRQWAYAITVALAPNAPRDGATQVVTLDLHVERGCIGAGLLLPGGTSFVAERAVPASPDPQRVVLRAHVGRADALILRNVDGAGRSRFRLLRAHAAHVHGEMPSYPVHVAPRRVEGEAVPGPGVLLFDDDAADAINEARMSFVRTLDLQLTGARVLDVGAGVGHFSRMYADLGAAVVAVEGRADNVRELRRRHPDVEAHVGDVQEMDLTPLGRFDLVHCFGLLYHLDSPVAVLRRLASVCTGVLVIETIVCDSDRAVMLLADETLAVNQALAGLGCRPSPSFVALALNRLGFPYVYGAASPPRHPDFCFEWRNSGESSRDGHNLRCVFVASRSTLAADVLIPLV